MQTNLSGQTVVVNMREIKTNGNGKKKPAPWDGICCESCWNAHEDKCVCRCGGVNHSRGRNGAYEKLEDFDEVKEIFEKEVR